MPRMIPAPGTDKPRPLKTELDTKRYTPTPRQNPLPIPDAGIFEAPYRCLKINKLWWSHVSGMIDVLSSEELWLGTPEEQAGALRQIAALLAYNECEDTVTPEEYEQASYSAIYRAVNDVAKQIVSGTIGGFSVDEDGEVITGGDDIETPALPEDDPGTSIDETEAARGGACFAIAYGVNAVIALANTYFGADATADMTPTEATDLIAFQYKVDEVLMLAALTDFWAIKAASSAVITSLTTATVASNLYCKGISHQSINRVVLAVAGGVGVPSKKATADIVNAITTEQLSDWYTAGLSVPTTAYLEFTCVPSPTEIMNIPLLATNYFSQTPFKVNHRLLISVESYFTDADGDTRDFFWYQDPPTLPAIGTVNFAIGGAGITSPSANQVPYTATHKYQFTLDAVPLAGTLLINVPSTGMTTPVAAIPGQGFKVTIEDQGEILV